MAARASAASLISHSKTLDTLAPELRSGGLEIEAIGADIEDLDGYRKTLDPDNIAEIFWTAHTDSKDAWQTEYRFTGA